jgi:hypothetical protein
VANVHPAVVSIALRYDVAFFWSINPFYHMYAVSEHVAATAMF